MMVVNDDSDNDDDSDDDDDDDDDDEVEDNNGDDDGGGGGYDGKRIVTEWLQAKQQLFPWQEWCCCHYCIPQVFRQKYKIQ